MHGSNTPNNAGTYGSLGVSDPNNGPGGRRFHTGGWADNSGNFWLFGGYGYSATTVGILNDFWRLHYCPTISCNLQLSENLTLCHDLNCSNSSSPAITITASDITLDLNGHTITTAEGQAGIRLASGVSNVTIKNGYIDGKGTAIHIPYSCSNIVIQNVDLSLDPTETAMGNGIWVPNGGQVNGLLLDNVTVKNHVHGIAFQSSNVSSNVTIKDCFFNDCSHTGMWLRNINNLDLDNIEALNNDVNGVKFSLVTGSISIEGVNVGGSKYGVSFAEQPTGFPDIDASTFSGFDTNDGAAFKFESYGNTNDITIKNVNVSYNPSLPPTGYGIWVQNGGQVNGLTLENVRSENHVHGIAFHSSNVSSNVTIKNSFFNDCSHTGMWLRNINNLNVDNVETQNNDHNGVHFSLVTGSITVSGVNVGGSTYGVSFAELPAGFPDIDASTFSGFSTNDGAAFKFGSYGNTNSMTIKEVDLSYNPAAAAAGNGIYVENGGQVIDFNLIDVTAHNRLSAVRVSSSVQSIDVTIEGCTFTENTYGLNLHNIKNLTIEGNDLRWNDYGLAIGTITLPLSVFHNTIYGNSVWNAFGDGAYELWNHDILEGNYWGLTCDVAAFQAGVTSNLTTITDDYAYGQADGWEAPPENKCSLPCRRALQELTMFVDAGLPNLNFGQGYAVAGGQFHSDQNSASYDNILDIVVANDNGYGWLYHGGASGYTKLDYSLGGPVAPGSGANRGLAVGFINDDSFPDIVISHLDHDTVFVYFGNGDGTVTLHQKLYVPRPMAIALGNLNAPDPNNPNASGRDNDLDAFVATGGDYKNYVLHNGGAVGSYNFTPVELVYTQGTTPTHTSTAACMADLDEDGDLDVLVTSYSDGYGSYTPVKPQFLRNNGVGAFDEPFPNLFNVEVRGKDIECGNIDGIGLDDVYLATSDGYKNYVFTGIDLLNGSSNIINVGFNGLRCNAATLQDFNNDGLTDVYVATDVGTYDIIQFNTGASPWYSTNFNFCNDDIEWIPGSYHKSYSVFAFDYEGDNDLDVYVGVGGANDVVYRNTLDPPNLAPTAEAGLNQTIECTSHSGMPVTLDGTQSSDPDNDALTYLWKLGSTQIATTATVQLTLGLGSYTYTLTVSDGRGGTHSDNVTILIKDETPPVLTMVTSPEVVSFSSFDLHQKFTFANIVSAVSDACDPAPVLKILSVTSDEPVEAPANNQQANSQNNPNTLDDIKINAFCNEVELRRERMTSDYPIPNTNPQEKVIADGRAYIITVEARDVSGNFTTGQYQVHIQSCNAGGNSQSNSGNGGNSSSNSNAGGNSANACPVTVSAVQYTATCGMSKSFEAMVAPTAVRLHPNYPNPFNPTTTLSFSLPYEGDMRMQVFDGLGRTVKSWEGRYPAGTHTLVFDASGLSSGVYFYRLITGSTVLTRKMLLTQ